MRSNALRKRSPLQFRIKALTIIACLAAALFAQPNQQDRDGVKAIWVEVFTPQLNEFTASDTPFLSPSCQVDDPASSPSHRVVASASLFLSLRYPLRSETVLWVELPWAYGRFENRCGGESGSTIGNPYLGIQMRRRNFPVVVKIGLRAPLASDESLATAVGLFSDLDRLETFLPNYVPISGMSSYRYRMASGVVFKASAGAIFMIRASGSEFLERTKWHIAYGAQFGYESEAITVLGEYSGRTALTDEYFGFARRSIDQLGLIVKLGSNSVQPGAYLRVPFNYDLKQTLKFVLGVHLAILL